MQLLSFETADPKRQLALDEAMLVTAEAVDDDADEADTESLRFWRFRQPTVVLGRSSEVDREVHRDYCAAHGIPILRRCTGGASIVGGPDCWMYSVVLRLGTDDQLRRIDAAHDHVMQHVLAAVQKQVPQAKRQGICDLTLGDHKFSGNSLRVARRHLLYHGTFLTHADAALIQACLAFAPRQPAYRRERDHREFVGGIDVNAEQLKRDLSTQFDAEREKAGVWSAQIERQADALLESRYRKNEWHFKR
ncbi:MAG: lipoate--protein ligase family protein [Planctomycetota bacterium]